MNVSNRQFDSGEKQLNLMPIFDIDKQKWQNVRKSPQSDAIKLQISPNMS